MERRKLLALLGGSVSLGVAGCLGGDDDNGDDDDGDDDTDDDVDAAFTVEITSSTDGVDPGETVTVEWEVINSDGPEATRTVAFSVDGRERDTAEVDLGENQREIGEFTYTPTADETGEVTVTVGVEDDEDSVPVTVREPAEAFFAVEITSPSPVRVESGDVASIGWAVENTGDLADTQTLVFGVDGDQIADEGVTLDGGETATGSFSYQPGMSEEGQELTATVESDDESEAVQVEVTEDLVAVSGFGATAEQARVAIDTDEPAADLAAVETDEPFVELDGTVFADGSWESTAFDVPDLVAVLSGLETEEDDDSPGAVESFLRDREYDELLEEVAEIIERFRFDEQQADAAGELLGVVAEAELGLPGLVGGIVAGVLEHPGDVADPVGEVQAEIDGLIQDLSGLLGDGDEIDTIEGVIELFGPFVLDDPPEFDEVDDVIGAFFEQLDEDGDEEDEDEGGLLDELSLQADPDRVVGTMDPSAEGVELLVTVPLSTVTLAAEFGDTELPEARFDLDLELTTGESNAFEGDIDLDTATDSATATVVDNEFTADLTEFDLLGLVEDADLVAVVGALLDGLDIDPDEEGLDLPTLVADLDVPALVADGDPLALVDERIEDEPGRHAVEADLELEFEDLGAVLGGE